MKRRVWFHRIRAGLWLVAGVLAFPLGWAYQVAFVTIASIYANVTSDWGAAEAADDRAVIDALGDIQQQLKELRLAIEQREGG